MSSVKLCVAAVAVKYELGDAAVRLLLDRIQGKHTQPKTINLMPQLRVRESCGFMLHSGKAPLVVPVG